MSNSHLVVVGSGIAGLYGALLAAEAGVRVTLLTKGTLAQSNTHQAQGGICAVLTEGEAAPGDSVEAHIADTLKAGANQCDPAAVRILCSEAAGDIAALERFGVLFDRDDTGRRALGLEGAHSAARILHAGGDATGAAIANGLIAAVRDAAELGLITLLEGCFATELLAHTEKHPALAAGDADEAHDAGTPPRAAIAGIAYLDPRNERQVLDTDAVLLATGGAGQLFEFTTNPQVATGDGVALAWRAGAVLADLEYFQFHPTALAVGRNFLISEAVRGAGAVLRDANGEAFMSRYHPEGDLAPRDVVARSIAAHLATLARESAAEATGDAPAKEANAAGQGEGPHHVFLDATGVEAANGPGYLARRFPTIDATTTALGFNWRRDWLPVAPAAHYWMGGIATDLHGRTSVPGLFAAGEAACTGVHGANRLASNSLLEGLVFSRRAVTAFTAAATGKHTWPVKHDGATRLPLLPSPLAGSVQETAAAALSRAELRHLMASHAGVVRDADGLKLVAAALATVNPARNNAAAKRPEANIAAGTELRREHEDSNLHLVAQLLVHAALTRENSVGAHFRADFPQGPGVILEPALSMTRKSNFWVNPVPTLTTAEPQRESETV
ncbi:L-aspartate oxidase [Arthrobacter sp. PAMC 25486]|uniref:L-aspartate oxidase n=1 Tax=Arthrobacter sp. PAMC 25486 TaxID=1494608 RepID=UPI000535CC86|nr:L-aspartate oxidase [Arthrobacter sp. PAMC 25486]AIY00996.1 L-aspartate oxidase [Arthrobacter sp. PAMC 25486]